MHASLIIWLVFLLSIVLMLARPWGIKEAWWVCGGAVILVVSSLVPLSMAGSAVMAGNDVYFFLTGMMLISELARFHGVFDWVAESAISAAKGSRTRLFTLLYAAGTLVTIFMSNDATAVVLTPAVLAAVKKCKVHPLPYLLTCALIANAASFVLPISNPANLVVFHSHMPPLGRWLAMFGLPSLFSILATYAVLRWYSRKNLSGTMETSGSVQPLTHAGRLVLWGIALLVAVLLGCSAADLDLGLPTFLTAVTIAIAISIRQRQNPKPLLTEISWSVIPLVAGLFILVRAVESAGALRLIGAFLQRLENLPRLQASLAAGFSVGVGTNLVNNLPLGLIAGAGVQAAHSSALVTNAVLIGTDLGPNLSVTGSLATILWLIAIRREGLDVSFWKFLRAGLLIMPPALLLACLALLV